jgi:hypothetical protein
VPFASPVMSTVIQNLTVKDQGDSALSQIQQYAATDSGMSCTASQSVLRTNYILKAITPCRNLNSLESLNVFTGYHESLEDCSQCSPWSKDMSPGN